MGYTGKGWGPGDWDVHQLIAEAEMIDSIPFVRLDQVREWKVISGREKDLEDVLLIDEYLESEVKV